MSGDPITQREIVAALFCIVFMLAALFCGPVVDDEDDWF